MQFFEFIKEIHKILGLQKELDHNQKIFLNFFKKSVDKGGMMW